MICITPQNQIKPYFIRVTNLLTNILIYPYITTSIKTQIKQNLNAVSFSMENQAFQFSRVIISFIIHKPRRCQYQTERGQSACVKFKFGKTKLDTIDAQFYFCVKKKEIVRSEIRSAVNFRLVWILKWEKLGFFSFDKWVFVFFL